MNTLEIKKSINLGIKNYDSIAYDGFNYFLLNKSNNIIDKYDSELNLLYEYGLELNVSHICYNKILNSFYAMEKNLNPAILLLNYNFKIENKYKLDLNLLPTDFTYDEDNDCYYVSDKNIIYKYNANFDLTNKYKYEKENFRLKSIYKNHFIHVNNSTIPPVFSFTINENTISISNFKYDVEIVDITFFNDEIFILAQKNNFSFLFISEFIFLEKNKNNKKKFLLNKNPPKIKSCIKTLTRKHSNPCMHSSKTKDICNRETSLCEIIHSIALIETSIAYILNTEGEKIQKVLESSNCIEDILKTNSSVLETIGKITMLEEILYKKLEITLNFK